MSRDHLEHIIQLPVTSKSIIICAHSKLLHVRAMSHLSMNEMKPARGPNISVLEMIVSVFSESQMIDLLGVCPFSVPCI
jgi:hypothetical protein